MPWTEGKRAYLAGEDLARRRRVKLSGSTVIYSDAGDVSIAVTEYAITSGTKGTCRETNYNGTQEVTAAAAIVAGAVLYGADDGKVSSVPAGPGIGFALEAASADGSIIEAILVDIDVQFAGMVFEALAADKTLDVQDVGKVFYVTDDAKVITLPSTVIGYGPIVIMNGGADAAVLVTVSPAAADKIMGADIAGANDKDHLNTKLTAIKGDYINIAADGADGWYISAYRGIWATQG